MTNVLITGIYGFVGDHLTKHLQHSAYQIYGFDTQVTRSTRNLINGDITKIRDCTRALKKAEPNIIFHLAGLLKSNQPAVLYKANVLGTISLFESLVALKQKPLVILASSSAVYGVGEKRIKETQAPLPKTHYAISKLAQEHLSLYYFYTHQIPVMIVRIFNLLGPRQSPALACSSFARQIALAEKHGKDEIFTGNLDALRDFVDVRDAVRAFEMIVENGKAGEIYNVCSGKAVSLKQCLSEMMSQAQKQLSARVDAEKFQKNDIPIQVGSYQKIKKACGWSPEISLRKSLTDLLNDWRERVKSNAE